jgi:hypothetical protein
VGGAIRTPTPPILDMRDGLIRVVSWLIDYPDQLARRTTAKQRRAMHFWLTAAWICGGSVLWLYLRSALWFVGFMSLYAIWVSHLAGWSAETPAEVEKEPPTEG